MRSRLSAYSFFPEQRRDNTQHNRGNAWDGQRATGEAPARSDPPGDAAPAVRATTPRFQGAPVAAAVGKRFRICPRCPFFCRVEERHRTCAYCGMPLLAHCACGAAIGDPCAASCSQCGTRRNWNFPAPLPVPGPPPAQPAASASAPAPAPGRPDGFLIRAGRAIEILSSETFTPSRPARMPGRKRNFSSSRNSS